MITIFTHRDGRTEPATRIDRAWLNPASACAAAQFWWLFGIMVGTIFVMLLLFRRRHWI